MTPLLKTRKDLYRQALNGGHSAQELSKVSLGSQSTFNWRGDCGHSWSARVKERSKRGTGCPFCSGRSLLKGFNDLQTRFPEVASQWHPSLNGGLKADEVSAGSHAKAWWLGPCGHAWEAQIKSRTFGSRGCGYCKGRAVLSGFNDLATTHPQLAKHVSKRSSLSPQEVSFGSQKALVWDFGCGHEFEAQVTAVVRGARCPYCSGHRLLRGFNDLESRYPQLCKEWDQSKNGKLKPSDFSFASSKKVFWSGSCGHAWQAVISNRSKLGHGCSICAGKSVMESVNDIATVFPQLLDEWDYEQNTSGPTQLSWGTGKNIYFVCGLGHSYKANPATKVKRNLGCPYCAFRKLLKGFNDFETICPDAAREWDFSKNKAEPSEFLPGSQNKFWFICDKGHPWIASLFSRYHTRTGCPSCAETGFNPMKPGAIYFLKQDGLRSFKVGITNIGTKQDRISAFLSRNWDLIDKWELEHGYVVYESEQLFFHWLRNEIGLPPSCTKDDLQGMSGFTETFTMGVISETLVRTKISKIIASVQSA